VKNNWVVIGKFARVHGIKGLITVQSFTDPVDNIRSYQPWHIYLKHKWCPITIQHAQIRGDKVIVEVDLYETREKASLLTNLEIAVPRENLPELEQDEGYYHHDLLGLMVVNTKQERLGTVIDVMATGANDIIVIQGDKRTLIPFVWQHYILSVDIAGKQIIVDWDISEE
jgi:16S rRNA processing protein RimM